MRIDPQYRLREIASLTVVVRQGTANVDMTRIISLNKSARLLYKTLEDKEFCIEDAARVLVDAYGISEERAMQDAEKWVESLKECGVIYDE